MQHLSSKKYEHLMHVSELFDGQCHQAEGDSVLLASAEVKQHLKNWSLIGSALRDELPAKIDLNFADKVMARIDADCQGIQGSNDTVSWVPPREEVDDDLPSLLQASNRDRFAQSAALQAEYHAVASKLKQAQAAEQELHELHELQELQDQPLADVAKVNSVQHKRVEAVRGFFTLRRLAVMSAQVAVAASVAVVAVVGMQTYNAADPVIDNQSNVSVAANVGPMSGLNLASYQNSDNELMMNLEQMPEPELKGTEGNQSNDIKAQQQKELERINRYVQGYVIDTAANH